MGSQDNQEISRKISPRELYENGVMKGGVQVIPPRAYKEKHQATMRSERRIPYSKFAGKVYYDESDLIEWAQKQKINMAS